MIVEWTDGTGTCRRVNFTASQFKTDEFNNLCIYVNSRCVKVFAVNTWKYVELESGE